MTYLVSSKLECEIIHIIDADKQVAYADTTSTEEYDVAFKFDSNQLDCELELNEKYDSENNFKLSVWNIPYSTIIVIDDIIRLTVYWQNDELNKYYTECVITSISHSFEGSGVKTIIEGTFLFDNILSTYGLSNIPTNISDVTQITTPIFNKFGLIFSTNILNTAINTNLINIKKSVSMLLDDFCKIYNAENNTDTCRWFIYGNSIVVEDTSIIDNVVEYQTPIINYIDIIKYKLVEETLIKKTIEIEISGLPSLKKESFITINYVNVPEYISTTVDSESYIVTEVSHKISTTKGFYSTIYCYLSKPTE